MKPPCIISGVAGHFNESKQNITFIHVAIVVDLRGCVAMALYGLALPRLPKPRPSSTFAEL
jgi:hypothetical protein